MNQRTKAFLFVFALWIFAQAVAWFYGGKSAAGLIAACSVPPLGMIALVISIEMKD